MYHSDSGPSFSRTAVALAPRHGDIVVTLDAMSRSRYLVAQAPGDTQAIVASQADAIELARTLAQLRSVDMWLAADGHHRLIDAFRPPDVL
jgi:hypothetical protein